MVQSFKEKGYKIVFPFFFSAGKYTADVRGKHTVLCVKIDSVQKVCGFRVHWRQIFRAGISSLDI
jgi:hypothetical protein